MKRKQGGMLTPLKMRNPKGSTPNKYKPHQGEQEVQRRVRSGRCFKWVNQSRYFGSVKI